MTETSLNANALAPSTDRCLAILEMLSEHPEGLSLSDLHRLLGVSKNMAFRILSDMHARGFVLRDAEKTYYLSEKLLTLASPRIHGRNLVDEAAPILRQLRDACGESVGLLTPSGNRAVLIYFQPSLQPVRMVFDLGFRLDLYCNAPGKVFLAFGDPAERARRLAAQSFARRTSHTICSADILEVELAEARRTGYTIDRAEDIEGAHCVAAPVYDHEGRLAAAIVLAGPSNRIPESSFEELGRQAAEAADRLTFRLKG